MAKRAMLIMILMTALAYICMVSRTEPNDIVSVHIYISNMSSYSYTVHYHYFNDAKPFVDLLTINDSSGSTIAKIDRIIGSRLAIYTRNIVSLPEERDAGAPGNMIILRMTIQSQSNTKTIYYNPSNRIDNRNLYIKEVFRIIREYIKMR